MNRDVPEPLRLRLPATSANLGPGFDAAALALALYLEVEAWPAGQFDLHASGRDAAICAAPRRNLLLATYREVLAEQGRTPLPLRLRLRNQIPIAKGCGSSAAARWAGILLAAHFGRLTWKAPRLLTEAAAREGHADNAAACWHGGLALCARRAGERRFEAWALQPPGRWPLLLILPPKPLATQRARATLPARYSRVQAVANVQSAMLLAVALCLGRRELLPCATEDQFHEPYRRRLCPLLPALKPLVGGDGICGVALSGAGPAVLVFPAVREVDRAHAAVHRTLRTAGLTAEIVVTRLSRQGAQARTQSAWRSLATRA